MPTYTIKDPQSGRTVVLRGDSPPTEAELSQIFAELDAPQGGEAAGDGRAMAMLKGASRTAGDFASGFAKSAGNTVMGLGHLARVLIPGVGALSDAMAPEGMTGGDALGAVQGELAPKNRAESAGRAVEQLLEFLVPAGAATRAISLPARMAREGAMAAGHSYAQGGSPTAGGVAGAAMPAAGRAVTAAGEALGAKALPLVRAAVKPTVTQLKRMPGASQTGIDAQANKLAQFILDHKLAKPEQAQAIIDAAEQELQAVLTAKGNPATQAPARAARYLQALQRSASKQGLPAKDVATIRSKAKELIEQSEFGEDVTSTVMQPSPSGLLGPNGQPVQVPVQVTSRQLRADMPAREALEKARATSRWETRKAYGEMKGAEVESSKAVERGARDAVKAAVPEAKPILQRQGQAIDAREALDRMQQRTANRETLSLPGLVGASASKTLGAAAQWLRNNQLKAGRYAKTLSEAIQRKDVQKVSEIMGRLGVAGWTQATATAGQ